MEISDLDEIQEGKDCGQNNANGMIRSLDNALCVLELLAAQSSEVSITYIAEHSGLHISKVFRMLNTLQARKYVTRNPYTKGFRLGLATIHLGEAAKRGINLIQQAHPILVRLSEDTRENACLTVLADNRSALIDQVSASGVGASPSSLGSQTHLYCTASGKILLGFSSAEFIEAYLSAQELSPLTPNTITDEKLLRDVLNDVRTNGFAIDDEEAWIGIRCIAYPVRDYSGKVVASIHIRGLSSQVIPEKYDYYRQHVSNAASLLSLDLGYHPFNN